MSEGNNYSSNSSQTALGEQRQLQYPLCALVAIAVLLNLIIFAWHCLYFRASQVTFTLRIFVVLFAGAMHVVYIVLDIALVLLLLYVDVQTTSLCKAGAFFIIYAILASVWTLTPFSVLLFGLTRSALLQQADGSAKRQVCHWRHLLVYVTLAAVHVIMAIVSFLPLTDLDYFAVTAMSDYYYVCAPLQLPATGAWQFSIFTLVLVWIPTLASSTAVAVTIVTTVKDKACVASAKFTAFPYNIVYHLAVDCGLWLLFVLLFSINFFSAGASIKRLDAVWLFAYLCVFITIVHPVAKCVLLLIKCRYGPPQPARPSTKVNVDMTLTRCPRTIQCVQQLTPSSSNAALDAAKYLILWTENGQPKQGTLKVFPTVALSKWQREVNAMTKLQGQGQVGECKNIVRCLWASQTNIYENVLRVYSPSSAGSILCLEHDSSETLKQFLNVSRPPEQQVQKIALDITAGLEYIHQHNIVHNGLTTTTIYVSSSTNSNSQEIEARIGDFENSYEIRCTSVASSVASDRDNEFAPDIRAFNAIVLDLLLTINSPATAHARPDIIPLRARSEGVQSRTSDDTSLAPSVCSCPVEVQDLRVCGAGDTSSPAGTSVSPPPAGTSLTQLVYNHNNSLERRQFNSVMSNIRELRVTSVLQSKAVKADSRRQQAAAKSKQHAGTSNSASKGGGEQTHSKPQTIFEDEVLQSHHSSAQPTDLNQPTVPNDSGLPTAIVPHASVGPIRNRSEPVKVEVDKPSLDSQDRTVYHTDGVVIVDEAAGPRYATSTAGHKQRGRSRSRSSSHDNSGVQQESTYVRHSEAETEDIWLNQYASKQQRTRDREDDRSSTDTNSYTRSMRTARPSNNLSETNDRPVLQTRTSEV